MQNHAKRAARILRKILKQRPDALGAYSALAAAYGIMGDTGPLEIGLWLSFCFADMRASIGRIICPVRPIYTRMCVVLSETTTTPCFFVRVILIWRNAVVVGISLGSGEVALSISSSIQMHDDEENVLIIQRFDPKLNLMCIFHLKHEIYLSKIRKAN